MKWFKAGLLDSVVSSYDQTKTTIQGRVAQKTLSGQVALGPPLSKFLDVFSDSGQAPSATIFVTTNGRLFVMGAAIAGTTFDTLPIMLYDFNLTTGVSAYVGRIDIQVPNIASTVTTVRSLKVLDNAGVTGWKIFIATTATVSVNGGLFLINNIDKADFAPVSFPTIPMATSSGAKAVYFLQDSANIGAGQLNIAVTGAILDTSGSNKIFVHNGVSATHQYYVYDTAVSPIYASASVTITAATPGVVTDAAHPYNNNDPIYITGLTGGTGLTNNNVYFVRNRTANTYELSATSGGASINTTTIGTATIGRAWGTTGSNWLYKTGNLPALTGTLLNVDSEYYALPINAPSNGGVLNGNSCGFLATSTNLYLGLLSELTSGVTTWPSLTTSNLLGTTNQITTPTAVQASWSNALDAATYITNTSKLITKQVVNNLIVSSTGSLNNVYYEGSNPVSVDVGFVTVTGLANRSGWTFIAGGTVGQRGVIAIDYRSDSNYDYSYIVSKVLNNPNSVLKFITTIEPLANLTGNTKVQYRTSGFGSITGGWIDITSYADLSALAITSNQIQFKILFNIQSEESSSPAQVNSLIIGVDANNGISDNWEFSDDFSDNGVPSRSAFRLKLAYATAVPTLFFRAYDLSDSLLTNHNSVTNAANFEYSTNGGTTWNALGTIPNTVGTLVRYTFTSPPGVDVRPGLKES